MKPLVIFKVGETFSKISEQIGDFEQWIVDGLGDHHLPISIVDPRNGDLLPNLDAVAGAIVTGSHSMVSDCEPWSLNLSVWLREAVGINIPILGICYGHQLLAHALGGNVGYHPGGIELGSVPVHLASRAKEDLLFEHLPEQFFAHAVHRQSVRSLPNGAVSLASNAFEPHQAFRIGDVAWGVQFHPEFSSAAMTGYIDQVMESMDANEAISQLASVEVHATLEAASVLPKFAQLVMQRLD